LRQCLSKPLGEEAPKKKIGNCYNKEECEKKIVKVVDHKSKCSPLTLPSPLGGCVVIIKTGPK
jgi:hypothetical protein